MPARRSIHGLANRWRRQGSRPFRDRWLYEPAPRTLRPSKIGQRTRHRYRNYPFDLRTTAPTRALSHPRPLPHASHPGPWRKQRAEYPIRCAIWNSASASPDRHRRDEPGNQSSGYLLHRTEWVGTIAMSELDIGDVDIVTALRD